MSEQPDSSQAVTLVDLIDQLAPPVEPTAVSMAPQTVGWAVLAVVLVVGLFIVAWRKIKHYRANAYRREALVQLAKADDDPAVVAAILRRTALAAYPREQVASLSGPAWLAFLDGAIGGSDFRSGAGRIVADAPYLEDRQTAGDLTALAERWIRRHRSGASAI